MINDTNQTPVVPAMHVFRLVEIHRDPDRVFPAETSEHSRNAAGMDGTGASGGIALLSKGVFDAYERALQCLRDVRHLLPSDGVAIVDAVLENPY
jgi:hypothetical protein